MRQGRKPCSIWMDFIGPAHGAGGIAGERSSRVDQDEVPAVCELAEQLVEPVNCIFYDGQPLRVGISRKMQGRLKPGPGKYRMHLVRDGIIVTVGENWSVGKEPVA